LSLTILLEEYNFEADRVSWDDPTRKRQLPYFCTLRYKTFVRKLPSYSDATVNWAAYQAELSNLYASQDENRKRGTRAFIESYVKEVQRRKPSVRITEYYQNFVTYFAAAQSRGQVTEVEKGHFFFRGLAREDMERVIHYMPKTDRPQLEEYALLLLVQNRLDSYSGGISHLLPREVPPSKCAPITALVILPP
jgi:hypothetical protein